MLALTTGLQNYFEYVDVTYTSCPNLTLQPYNLAAKGKQVPTYFYIL